MYNWATSAHYTLSTYGVDVAMDRYGNAYATGNYHPNSGPVPQYQYGSYLNRYNTNGTLAWNKIFLKGYDNKVAVSENNTILSAGKDTAGYYIIKYDTTGTLIDKQYLISINDTTGGWLDINDIGCDSLNNYYILGTYYNRYVTIGTNTFSPSANTNFFIAKFNSSNSCLWAKASSGADVYSTVSFFIKRNGDCYFSAAFTGTLTIGTSSLNALTGGNHPSSTGMIGKISSGGSVQTLHSIGTSAESTVRDVQDIVCDNSGNIYIAGNYWAQFTEGTYTFTSYSAQVSPHLESNIFIIKYDSTFSPLWGSQIGDQKTDLVSGITVNSNGVFVSGMFESYSRCGETVLTSSSTVGQLYIPNEAFVAAHDINGNFIGAQTIGCDENTVSSSGKICSSADYVYTTGRFKGRASFGGHEQNSNARDMYLTQLTGLTTGMRVNNNTFSALNVYPNPGNAFKINCSVTKVCKFEIKIMTSTGHVILHETKNNFYGIFEKDIDLSRYPKGIYFIEVSSNGLKEIKKQITD